MLSLICPRLLYLPEVFKKHHFKEQNSSRTVLSEIVHRSDGNYLTSYLTMPPVQGSNSGKGVYVWQIMIKKKIWILI